MEKETLEEAAKNTTIKYVNEREKHTAYLEFIEGAKLQDDQNKNKYSEEEVLVILDKFLTSMIKGEKTGLIEEWFEQFKKK